MRHLGAGQILGSGSRICGFSIPACLHLVTALHQGFEEICTFDRHQQAAVQALGLSLVLVDHFKCCDKTSERLMSDLRPKISVRLSVEAGDETARRFGVGRDARAVDGKKGVGRGKSRALVAVDERMVLCEAFPPV